MAAPRRSSSPTACSPRTRAADTSCAACCAGRSRMPDVWASRVTVLDPSIDLGGRRVRRRLSGAARERGVRAAGRRVPRRSGSRRRSAGVSCCSRRRRGERSPVSMTGRRRVQALRHVRLPDRADDGARRRGRAERRRGRLPRAARGAARTRARAAAKKVEVGLDAGAVPPTEFVGYAQPGVRGDDLDAARCEPRRARGRAGRRRGRALVPRTERPSTRRPVARSATTVRSAPRPARCAVRDAQWAGPTSIMHIGTVDVRRGASRPGGHRRDRPPAP